MSFLAKLWSMLFGGGTIVSAVDDAIKLGSQVTAEVHDKNQRDAGASAQREKDDTDELSAIREGNAAAADPAAIQRVREAYELKRP